MAGPIHTYGHACDTGGTTKGSNAGGALTAVALVVSVIATAGLHISGGHVNPAVTLSLAVGGHITLFHSSLYIATQMLCSSAACFLSTNFLLRWLTGGLGTPVHVLAEGVGPVQGVVAETVFTFRLVFVIYATILDARKLHLGAGPLLTGLLVGVNSIAGAVLSGASMNPARSFGPAVPTGVWTHHWVYWVGPLAVVVYECSFMAAARTHDLLPQDDDP
ncbi:aquaporin TIP4-3-like [Miscanthus floridulus]|uniref:aquaporin TIP4-3-like n=1 Tax=Miscanthus floridulus TaxID=154761 RepID=UPI003457F188